jgi:hypothetical protein
LQARRTVRCAQIRPNSAARSGNFLRNPHAVDSV